jgi:hypothetical protein
MRGTFITALSLSAMLTACSTKTDLAPDANEQYTRDFIRHFGSFDPGHDWNMATRASVEVNASTPTDYRVYAEIDGQRYLAGTFEGVEGTQTLSVDVPKGTQRVSAEAGSSFGDTPLAWIIAAEDLGHNDFDFNDVVFGVINYKVSGYKGTVEIVPLAAGGTRPIHILYKGKEIDGGEFHSWFEGNHTSATPINVGGYSAKGISRTLEVGTDFTMSCVDGESNMGGFAIRVDKPGEQTSTTINAPDFNAGVLEAPQMICVPQTWQWPSEQTPITDAYRDFTAWCADQTAATDWHTRPEEGMTIGHDFATQLPENVFVLECGSPNETMAYSNGTYYKKFTYTLPEEALKQLNATRTSTLIVYIPLENDMKYHLGSYDSDATFTGRTSTNATEFTIPHDKISYFNTEPLLVVSYMYCREDFSQNIMIEIN